MRWRLFGCWRSACWKLPEWTRSRLQPAAGAQGELTGILLIRAYLQKQGNPRKIVLIPDSAHGTNPATAVIAGYGVENIKSTRMARSIWRICGSR